MRRTKKIYFKTDFVNRSYHILSNYPATIDTNLQNSCKTVDNRYKVMSLISLNHRQYCLRDNRGGVNFFQRFKALNMRLASNTEIFINF